MDMLSTLSIFLNKHEIYNRNLHLEVFFDRAFRGILFEHNVVNNVFFEKLTYLYLSFQLFIF
jgi:hypothetical protein